MSAISIRACAKVNLDLRVLHRRPDGYHEIRTIFQELALHDTLTVRRARGPFTFSVAGGGAPADDTNIVWKAALAVWGALGRPGEPRGAAVRLVKRIPMQAGLGGGSSDAAAALRALNDLWQARLSTRDLFAMAGALGADVPFFLVGGTALGLGRGDEVYPLPDLPSSHVVIACPPGGVSTAEAYAALGRSPRESGGEPQEIELPWPPGSRPVVNDFEPVVSRALPDVRRLREGLLASGAALAQLSGSGSAVFGLFGRERDASRAARRLAREPGVRTWITRFRRRRRGPGEGFEPGARRG